VQEHPEWWRGVKTALEASHFAKEIHVEGLDYAYQTSFICVLPRNVRREVRLNTRDLPNMVPAMFIKVLQQWTSALRKKPEKEKAKTRRT